jgi:hypothetical protein
LRVSLQGALIALSALSKQFNNTFDFYIFVFWLEKAVRDFRTAFVLFVNISFQKWLFFWTFRA